MSKSNIEKMNRLMRTQLSASFFFRDFIYSETAAVMGINNTPSDVELAIAAGEQLCQNVLEPIQEVWGRLHIRSAFRSAEVNQKGNELKASCASNERNYAAHIWDRRDNKGFMGATACIVVPKYLPYYEKTKDWTSLAWWIHHHIPAYSSMTFFPELCAFNIRWREDTQRLKEIGSYIDDPKTGHSKAIFHNGKPSEFYERINPVQRYSACSKILQGTV